MLPKKMTRALIILRGLPGSGKTSFAELLKYLGEIDLETNQVRSFAADDYFVNHETGEYNFDPEKLGAAHNWCITRVEFSMSSSTPFIVVHNTNTTEREMKSYMELADKYSYPVFRLIVENHHGSKDVHNVPEEALERMKNRFSVKL